MTVKKLKEILNECPDDMLLNIEGNHLIATKRGQITSEVVIKI